MNNTPHTNCLTLRLLHAAKGYKAVAFDIFDTLLKRDCARPADLFALMEVTHQRLSALPRRALPQRQKPARPLAVR